MRFTPILVTVIGFTFSTSAWSQPGDCVPAQTPSDSAPRIEGTQMPPEKLEQVTSEDRDRFDREHPDLSNGDIPAPKETSTPEEREAAQRQFDAERQQHPEGRPREFYEPQHTADEQRHAQELMQQKPCPPQEP